MSQRSRFRDAVPSWSTPHAEPWIAANYEKQKSRRRVENIGDGLSQMGMIRNPRSMWPFLLNKWLAARADELGERRYPNDTGGSESHSYRIRPMRERPNHSRFGMAFRLWNALPPETLPAQSAGSLFDGDEGPANVRCGSHYGPNSDIALCLKSADTVAKVFLGCRMKIHRAADAFCARGPYRLIQN
jgi:hypothetical protein